MAAEGVSGHEWGMTFRPRSSTRSSTRAGLAVALVLAFVSVGCDGDPIVALDASPPLDGSVLSDASLPDAGAPDATVDASSTADAGPRSFLARYPLDARFPEGGIYDPASHSFFVGSLDDGTVHRVDAATGAEAVFFSEDAPGVWWTLGMDVDLARNRLFVCAMDDRRGVGSGDPAYLGYVWVLDLETGTRVARYDLSDAFVGATCTDVAVAADGSAYVCDRESPNIYRIAPGGGLSLFVTDPLLDSSVIGQNALVVLPDQSALLSVVYLPSRLLRVGLSDGVVTEVSIDGDFFDGLPALSGADGMTLSDDGTLLVQFTSQLNRLSPILADWSTATSATIDVPAGMTDVLHTPGGDYLLNGQAVSFAFDRTPEPFALVRFDGAL